MKASSLLNLSLVLLIAHPSMCFSQDPLAPPALPKFTSIEQIAATLPPAARPRGKDWNPIAMALASDEMQAATAGSVAELTLKLASINTLSPKAQMARFSAVREGFRLGSARCMASVGCTIAMANATPLATAKPNLRLKVRGTIASCRWAGSAALPQLIVELKDCELIP